MKHFSCDVCGQKCDESSSGVVRVMYSTINWTLRERQNRNKSYGGSRGSFDLCETCRLLSINNRVAEIITSSIIEKLKELKAN